jgi:Rap1a immunity proteins
MFTGKIIFIALVILLVGTAVNSEPPPTRDGNKLLHDCITVVKGTPDRPEDGVNAGWCLGYLAGISDMRGLIEQVPNISPECTPQEVTMAQKTRILMKYLNSHPEELHRPSVVLVVIAMNEAFPCHTQTAPR